MRISSTAVAASLAALTGLVSACGPHIDAPDIHTAIYGMDDGVATEVELSIDIEQETFWLQDGRDNYYEGTMTRAGSEYHLEPCRGDVVPSAYFLDVSEVTVHGQTFQDPVISYTCDSEITIWESGDFPDARSGMPHNWSRLFEWYYIY